MKNELLNESLLSIELINEGHIALETGFALKSGEERTPTRKTTYKANFAQKNALA